MELYHIETPDTESTTAPDKQGKHRQKIPEIGETSWSEFTQNTSFHGIKYIFEAKELRCRR